MILFSSCVLLGLLLFPRQCSSSAMEALRIWGRDVVPSLFPYMVFCRQLGNQLRQKHLPAIPVIALLGLLGGSPSGAAVIGAYSVRLNHRALFACCALTGAISPMFLIATVSKWISGSSSGLYLMISLLSGAVFAALIVSRLPLRIRAVNAQMIDVQQIHPIQDSIQSILGVGGCIVIYSVLAELVSMIPFLPDGVKIAGHIILEVSGGMHALTAESVPYRTLMVLLGAASGFGGLSILSQNLSFLRPCGVSAGHLLLFSALRAGAAACTMALILR